MHVDRTAVQSPASAPASLAVRAHGGGRPALPGIPGPLDALLRPQKEEFRFTETSYYAIEHWEPMPMDAAQATAAHQLLRQVEAAMAPAEKGRLLTRVLALLSHYRSDPNPPEVEFAIAEDWAEDLGEFPAWAVDEAAREWRRSRKFKPQICEMRDACQRIASREMVLLARLRRLVEADEARRNPSQRRAAALASGLAASWSARTR